MRSRERMAVLVTLALVLATGCGRPPAEERGVRLMLAGDTLEPTTTLEFRFEEPVIESAKVGVVEDPSPLKIAPSWPGEWTWLSRRSGVFTPTEPPALGNEYQLSLAWKSARLERPVRTPPFGFGAQLPYWFDTNNVSVTPRLNLAFNADVLAEEVGGFLIFLDDTGRRIPGVVRQARPGEGDGLWMPDGFQATWRQRFARAQGGGRLRRAMPRSEVNDSSRPEFLSHGLIVSPASPLPEGSGWRLQVRAGLPSVEPELRLEREAWVRLGRVQPFEPVQVEARSGLNGGRRLVVQFSKTISPEINETNVMDWISVQPRPDDLDAAVGSREITLSGDFGLEESYTVQLKRGFPAREAVRLNRDVTETVSFLPLPPRLRLPALSTEQLSAGRRQFDLLAVNVQEVRLRAKLLDEASLVPALRGYRSYRRPDPWDDAEGVYEPFRGLDYNVLPGRTIWQTNRLLGAAIDESARSTIAWDEVLAGRQAGALFLDATVSTEEGLAGQRPGTQALVQVTDLGLYWKRSDTRLWVLPFSYRTGRPLAGVKVQVVTDENELLAQATNQPPGLVELPLDPRGTWLVAAYDGDLRAAELREHSLYLDGRYVVVRYPWEAEPSPRQVLLFSDRGLYRPGETLHLKAIVRDQFPTGTQIPQGAQGRFTVHDARDRVIHTQAVEISEHGGWAADVALPSEVRGGYRAELRFGTNEVHRHYFQVQDYEPDAFSVSVNVPGALAAGDPVLLPVSARYLFGDEVGRGTVRWSVRAEDAGFAPEGFGGFAFGPRFEVPRLGAAGTTTTLHGETNYARGRPLVLAPEIPLNPAAPQPRAVEALVQLTDLNQQTLSSRVGFVRHSSDFYLGAWQETGACEQGEPWPLRLVAVDTQGKPWPEPVTAHVKFQKVDWQTVRVQGTGGGLDYRSEPVLTLIREGDGTVQQAVWNDSRWEPAMEVEPAFEFTPPTAGQYVVEATALDPAGRPVMTTFPLYASGPLKLAWDYRSPALLGMVPDRTNYLAGETATLLLKAPFSGLAVVSVERDRVMRSFVTNLTGNAPRVFVPLSAEDAPNAYVTVMLLRGLEQSPKSTPEPEYSLGSCQLHIEQPETRLEIALELPAVDILPGAPVTVRGLVRDGTGQPAAGAEVTLYAVDEGVLSLVDPGVPDPHAVFYGPQPLAVWSHCTLPALLPEDPEYWDFHNKGFLIGGGGKEGSALRQRFLACAYWNANLSTDAAGRVQVSFPAPDSLTRYRVVAVAQTAQHQFGASAAAFRVNKPLMLQPALPAFAHAGDRLQLRTLVHNRSTHAGAIEVAFESDSDGMAVVGIPEESTLASGAKPATKPRGVQRITMEPGAITNVDFPVHFLKPGQTRWIWRARFLDAGRDAFTDAVESHLAVQDPAPELREVLLTRSRTSTTNLLAGANAQLLEGPGKREIQVRVSNSRLGGVAEAVQHLLQYPYGCSEQTVSALLPWIALSGLPPGVAGVTRSPEEGTRAIRRGLDRLLLMQTADGGLAYWPGGRTSQLWLSAYGGVALALAERLGCLWPADRLDRLRQYLREGLAESGRVMDEEELAPRVLALWALTLWDQPEWGYAEALFAQRDRMSLETRATLALSLPMNRPVGAPGLQPEGWVARPGEAAGASGQNSPQTAARFQGFHGDARVEELLRPKVKLPAEDGRWFGCAARGLALQLLAWCQCRPEAREVDTLVEELLHAREGGHWTTTQGNAWALLALAEYARSVEGERASGGGELKWGEQVISFELGNEAPTFERTLQFEGAVDCPPLWLDNPNPQPWFAQATIVGRSRVVEPPRQDRGFGLQRRYDLLRDDGSLEVGEGEAGGASPPANGWPRSARVGDRILVTLRIEVRQLAHYVAVNDPLPAILEAVNPEFRSRVTAAAEESQAGDDWVSDYRELRSDRALFFCDRLHPGTHFIRYLARVRAAGEAIAPGAKIEEMYHPERWGLSETIRVRAEDAL